MTHLGAGAPAATAAGAPDWGPRAAASRLDALREGGAHFAHRFQERGVALVQRLVLALQGFDARLHREKQTVAEQWARKR